MVVVDTDIDGGCTYINFFSACLLLRIYFFSSARKFIFMHIQKKWNFHEKSSYIQFHVFFCVICKRSINIHKNVAMDWAILSSKCVCVSIHRFLFFKLLKIGGIYTQHETDTKWKRAIPEKRQSELQAIRKMNRQKFTKKKNGKLCCILVKSPNHVCDPFSEFISGREKWRKKSKFTLSSLLLVPLLV